VGRKRGAGKALIEVFPIIIRSELPSDIVLITIIRFENNINNSAGRRERKREKEKEKIRRKK